MTSTAEFLVRGRFQPVVLTPTLEDELGPLPVVGVRRLIVSVLRLATELDLGQQSRRAFSNGGRGPLSSLGRRIARILAEKPLYLEGSMWTPSGQADSQVLRRSADAEVVTALARALSCIARRCVGGTRRYETASELVIDLSRLAAAANRVVARRRAAAPVVSVHYPKPASRIRCGGLPRVIVQAAGTAER